MKHRLSFSTAFASALYIGFIPGMPGTYASVATTLAFWLVCGLSNDCIPSLHLSAVCLITVIGVLTASKVSRDTGMEDPSLIVIDEVAGQLLTFLFLPVTAVNLILGTVAFRIFDIWKPFPVRNMESLKGGTGIMADDLMAGVYANLLLQILNLSFALL
jgi:phosphatidylglycerophosphatase A